MTILRHVLLAHPATACPQVQQLHVTLERSPQHPAWRLRYELAGELAALRLPPQAAQPAPTDGLWRHSCFEAFVARTGQAAYREFNFSPSGHWAAYAFGAERVPDAAAPTLPAPRIACARDATRLRLDAWLPGPVFDDGDLQLGLSAVIETLDGQLSYWALAHPCAQPNFHHRAGWTARLPALPTTP